MGQLRKWELEDGLSVGPVDRMAHLVRMTRGGHRATLCGGWDARPPIAEVTDPNVVECSACWVEARRRGIEAPSSRLPTLAHGVHMVGHRPDRPAAVHLPLAKRAVELGWTLVEELSDGTMVAVDPRGCEVAVGADGLGTMTGPEWESYCIPEDLSLEEALLHRRPTRDAE